MKYFLTIVFLISCLFSSLFSTDVDDDGEFACGQSQVCMMQMELHDANGSHILSPNSHYCRCSPNMRCPDGWSGDNVIREITTHPSDLSAYIIISYKFCESLRIPSNTCNELEPAAEFSMWEYNYIRLEEYHCRCENNSTPLILVEGWSFEYILYTEVMCPSNVHTCQSGQKCWEEYYDQADQLYKTRYNCLCPNGETCENSWNQDIGYGYCQ